MWCIELLLTMYERCLRALLKKWIDNDGYPLYRRRKPEDGGFTAKVTVAGCTVDNWQQMDCSLLLTSLKNVHCSYQHWVLQLSQGNQVHLQIRQQGKWAGSFSTWAARHYTNEVARYQIGRYISSNEAACQILDFPIYQRYPPVEHLSVHLENDQRVYFPEDNMRDKVAGPPRTTLTAFFELWQQDEFAKPLLYCDVPR